MTGRPVVPDEPGGRWERVIDTPRSHWQQRHRLPNQTYRLSGRSLAVFVRAEAG